MFASSWMWWDNARGPVLLNFRGCFRVARKQVARPPRQWGPATCLLWLGRLGGAGARTLQVLRLGWWLLSRLLRLALLSHCEGLATGARTRQVLRLGASWWGSLHVLRPLLAGLALANGDLQDGEGRSELAGDVLHSAGADQRACRTIDPCRFPAEADL